MTQQEEKGLESNVSSFIKYFCSYESQNDFGELIERKGD